VLPCSGRSIRSWLRALQKRGLAAGGLDLKHFPLIALLCLTATTLQHPRGRGVPPHARQQLGLNANAFELQATQSQVK